MLPRTIRIKNPAPPEDIPVFSGIRFHRYPELILAPGIRGCRTDRSGFLRQFLTGDLVFDASPQHHQVSNSALTQRLQEFDAVLQEAIVFRRLEVYARRSDPGSVKTHFRPELLDLSPGRF